jgi:phosphocarrier protein HPr
MPERRLQIINKRGLHARASAKFVTIASSFDAQVKVTNPEGSSVGGTSIMGLMMLAAAPGDFILIETSGAQADAALAALCALVEARFHEAE